MKDLHEVFRMLGSPTRLAMVTLLARSSPLCVNSIAHKLGMSQSVVSQHLRVLKMGGWVKQERRGYWRHYSLERKELLRLSSAIDKLSRSVGKNPCSGAKRSKCISRKGGTKHGR